MDLRRDIAVKTKSESFITESVSVANKRAMHQKESNENKSNRSRMQLNSVKGELNISSYITCLTSTVVHYVPDDLQSFPR